MKIFKNAMISTLLLSSMAFGVAHGNNTDAIESNESQYKRYFSEHNSRTIESKYRSTAIQRN
ncbi:hypothetical protein ABFP08_05610 [Mammaliicoccus sciuri]